MALAAVEEDVGLPVSLCELTAVFDPAGVRAAVTETLGFGSMSGLALGLADAELLVLLDNAEHHLDAVADVAHALLTEVPGLRLLVTSQVPLGLPGEWVTVLAPLPVPDGDDPVAALASPAVQLFAARALEAGPSSSWTSRPSCAWLPSADDSMACPWRSSSRRLALGA